MGRKNDNARKFAEEMISSGTVAKIKAAAIGFLYERKDGVEYNPPLIEDKR